MPRSVAVGLDLRREQTLWQAGCLIVAKVTRDRRMNELAARYPAYHFEQHKGYSTPTRTYEGHLDALARLGPVPGVHHFSAKSIKRLVRAQREGVDRGGFEPGYRLRSGFREPGRS